MIYNQNAFHFSTRSHEGLKRWLILQLYLHTNQLKACWENLKQPEVITKQQLSSYPQRSLGKDLSNQINQAVKKKELNALLFELLFPSYRNDKRVSFVLLGNGKRNMSLLVDCGCLWITGYEDRDSFWKAYSFGKSLNKFTYWDLSYLFKEPTALIKAMILKESVGVSEAPIIW